MNKCKLCGELHEEHHIFCNFFFAKERWNCKQCQDLYEKYPTCQDTVEYLLEQIFPDVVKRGG